jgi:hypothetical protein
MKEDFPHHVLHADTIMQLATGFALTMIESPGARIVVATSLTLGIACAALFRILRRNDPGVPSILATKTVIK